MTLQVSRDLLFAIAIQRLGGSVEVQDSELEAMADRGEVIHTRLRDGVSRYTVQMRTSDGPGSRPHYKDPRENSRDKRPT